MKPEAQRIAIAEACGWHSFRQVDNSCWGMDPQRKKTSLPTQPVPDYFSDLNAMHEAEKGLTTQQMIIYGNYLICLFTPELCPEDLEGHPKTTPFTGFWLVHINADQRAKAFLKTIGKWEESK